MSEFRLTRGPCQRTQIGCG